MWGADMTGESENNREPMAFWDPLKAGPVPKKVDEDWKRKAREESKKLVTARGDALSGAAPGEKGAAAPTAGPAGAGGTGGTGAKAVPSRVFVEFLTEIATQAAYHLQGRQLEQARYTIEILETLREKTKGNLADEEQKLMDRYLYELQMQYVQVLKGASAAGKRAAPDHA